MLKPLQISKFKIIIDGRFKFTSVTYGQSLFDDYEIYYSLQENICFSIAYD